MCVLRRGAVCPPAERNDHLSRTSVVVVSSAVASVAARVPRGEMTRCVSPPPLLLLLLLLLGALAQASVTSAPRRSSPPAAGGEAHQSPLDPWSIVWYIGSFGGLIAFFLIVSCSEWCCRRGARPPNAAYAHQRSEVVRAPGSESPPPPYHLFAPPPYDSVGYAEEMGPEAKDSPADKLAVYVIKLPA